MQICVHLTQALTATSVNLISIFLQYVVFHCILISLLNVKKGFYFGLQWGWLFDLLQWDWRERKRWREGGMGPSSGERRGVVGYKTWDTDVLLWSPLSWNPAPLCPISPSLHSGTLLQHPVRSATSLEEPKESGTMLTILALASVILLGIGKKYI